MRAFVLFLLAVSSSAYYVSHSFSFPSIPYSAGVYHIHSPVHFMGVHGFALPGFQIIETREPCAMGGYISAEFFYKTHFTGNMSGRVFSSFLNTSHVVLMDPDGIPCLLGKLTLHRCSSNGHGICARADLLRPASAWERMFGGQKLVKESDVALKIKLGYSDFKNDINLHKYVRMVLDCDKKR